MREKIFIGAVFLILLIVGMAATGTLQNVENTFDKAKRAVMFVNSQAHVQEAARHAGIEAHTEQENTSFTTQDLESAAKLGNFRAQMLLSSAYLIGKKVPQDTDLAITWYLKAVNHPDLEQAGGLNLFLRKLEIALYSKLLEDLEQTGEERQTYIEDGQYDAGVRGSPEYLVFAGALGHSLHARALYSFIYYDGSNTLRESLPSDAHVFKWLEQAALKGSKAHQILLINFYKKQEKNPEKLKFWEDALNKGNHTNYFNEAISIARKYIK